MFIPIGDDNSQRRLRPYLTWLIVLINGGVWYLQLTLGDTFTYGYSVVPFEITKGLDLVQPQAMTIDGQQVMIPQMPGPAPIYLTLLSAMFMHGSWMHILGNMLYLLIFGDQIEDLLGRARFLIFYLLCGLAAGAAHIMVGPDSLIPSLGASGAIAGVLAAYLVKYPRNAVRVWLLRYIISLPAFIVLGGWIALQLVAQVSVGLGGHSGVAYMAHIGGFAAGLILVWPLSRPRGKRRARKQKRRSDRSRF